MYFVYQPGDNTLFLMKESHVLRISARRYHTILIEGVPCTSYQPGDITILLHILHFIIPIMIQRILSAISLTHHILLIYGKQFCQFL